MTGLIGRLNRTRRRSYPLKRFRRHKLGPAVVKDSGIDLRPGVVVVREWRRDPNWTQWTFDPTLRVSGNIDVVELLGRDNDDPIVPGPE
jgi:hypothetical protein